MNSDETRIGSRDDDYDFHLKRKYITRELAHVLTESELLAVSRQTADEHHELGQTQTQKKLMTQNMGAKIKTHEREISRMANMTRTGKEWRETECEEIIDFALGSYRVIRLDGDAFSAATTCIVTIVIRVLAKLKS